MREIPMLFKTEMVKAILDGRKTQTRRISKISQDDLIDFGFNIIRHKSPMKSLRKKIPFVKGDIIWVKETFIDLKNKFIPYLYKANCQDDAIAAEYKWKPSLFMPKSASRIRLEITNVRLERLQDITEGDAIAEGINLLMKHHLLGNFYQKYSDRGKPLGCLTQADSAIESYRSLWELINGSDSWDLNPWVWVIEFKKL